MKNTAMAERLGDEILQFIDSRKSLMLSSIREDGSPYASYAPFAVGDNCLYVLLSEIAVHAINLQQHPKAAVLIIEDEDGARELFARLRVNYTVDAEMIEVDTAEWQQGIATLSQRHGDRIIKLSELKDFKLFRLLPTGGRYVKDFGRAYSLAEGSLADEGINHLRDGHQQR